MALNFGKLVKNPMVIGGAAVLAVAVFALSRGGSGATGNDGSNISTALLSTQAANNQAGLNYAAQRANIAASVDIAGLNAKSAETLNLFSTVQNMFAVLATNANGAAQTSAGVVNTAITSNAALATELNDNAVRLATSYVSADIANSGNSAQVEQTRITAQNTYATATAIAAITGGTQQNVAATNAGATEAVAQDQQNSQMFASLVNGLSNVFTKKAA